MEAKFMFKVAKPRHTVYEYQSVAEKFVSVHPVIHKMEAVGGNLYLVHETLRFLGIPFSFKYRASVKSDAAKNEIYMHAVVFGITKIDMVFALGDGDNHTEVTEHVKFQSIFPIPFLLKRIFKKQHARLFKNLGKA